MGPGEVGRTAVFHGLMTQAQISLPSPGMLLPPAASWADETLSFSSSPRAALASLILSQGRAVTQANRLGIALTSGWSFHSTG